RPCALADRSRTAFQTSTFHTDRFSGFAMTLAQSDPIRSYRRKRGSSKYWTGIFALTFACVASVSAIAEEWPARPIRFIVPFPAGGSTDVGDRVIAESLSRTLGQQIVVENKSGASGNVGFGAAARSAPDGYTVLITPDQIASAPHVFK